MFGFLEKLVKGKAPQISKKMCGIIGKRELLQKGVGLGPK